MELNSKRAFLVVALGLCLGPLAGCPTSELCSKCGLECKVSTTTAVAWTEQTALGSPEQIFSSFAGSCQAPFQWDASGGSGTLTVTPARGQSTLTATVALNPASARLLTHTPAACPDTLQIDGTATLALPDGNLANQQPFTLSASAGMAPTALSFTLKEADFGPWVSVQKTDPSSTLSMPITVSPVGRACSGQVTIGWQLVKNGMGSAWGGPFASWSDTGCGVGQTGVSLDQPWQGIDVAAAIASVYGRAALSGTWSDSSTTALTLTTSTAVTVACAETLSNGFTVVTVPVEVLASTADGRVQALAGQGSIRVSVNQASLWQLELNASTDLPCASEAATLAYSGASCATDRKVTAQLHFSRTLNSPTTDGGSLELYVYERQSTAVSSGAADRVDRLMLGP